MQGGGQGGRDGGDPGGRGGGDPRVRGGATRGPLRPIAKITRPAAEGAVRRERLFRRLDQAGDRPLTWISGPAGSGKTVLAGSYVEDRKLTCIWYQVDPGDSDLAGFFYYLSLAGEGAVPAGGDPLPLLTPEYLPNVPEFSRRFFEALFARLSPPAVLVFDNLDEVPADAGLHRALLAGLARLPARVRLILVSRAGPPPPYARALASREITLLGWEDLRLTPGEFREIARIEALGAHQERVLQTLYRRMDGWAAGLQLVLEGVSRHDIDLAGNADFTPNEIFEYFAHEVFQRLDEGVRSFLTRTAFLPAVTPAMARSLTGHPRAGRILAHLHRNNHFTERRGQLPPVYQYHPLFREFLLEQARTSLTPAETAGIQRAAAGLLAEAGHGDEAAGLLRDAADWGALSALILDSAPTLVDQGRHLTLQEWIEHLPRRVREGSPWLLYWSGVSLLPFEPARARSRFEHALGAFEALEHGPGELLAWSGVVDSIVWGFKGFEPLDEWAERFETRTKRHWPPGDPAIASRVTASMLYTIAMRQPRHPDRESWIARGLALVDQASLKVQVLTPIVSVHIFGGDLVRAGQLLMRFEALERSGGLTPVDRISLRNLTTFWSWLSARFEKARREGKAGLELARRLGVHLLDFFLLGNTAAGALGAGDLAAARELLGRMADSIGGTSAWERGLYHLLSAWEALLRRDGGAAAPHARALLDCATRAGMPWSMGPSHLTAAHVAHAQGDEAGALRHLQAAARWAEATGSHLDALGWRLAMAELLLGRGEEEAALEPLRQGLEIGRRHGHLNWWLFRPEAVARLCVKALEKGIEVPYVQELVRRRGLVPERPPLEVEGWPWPLRVYTLGRFEIVRDGEPVRFAGKAQRRPLGLLKALIAFGGRNVSEARIADALWADAECDMALGSCSSALHRLRRLLGCTEAIRRREGRLTLDARRCWVDSWAFERAMGRAEAAWAADSGERDRAAGLAAKALSLYTGSFLAQDLDAPWAMERRERLRSRFRRGVERLCRDLEAAGRWEEAAEHYERALGMEPLVEAFYRGLVDCYRELGRTAEALETCCRCREVLASRLGIAPSPRTEAAFRRLGSR